MSDLDTANLAQVFARLGQLFDAHGIVPQDINMDRLKGAAGGWDVSIQFADPHEPIEMANEMPEGMKVDTSSRFLTFEF